MQQMQPNIQRWGRSLVHEWRVHMPRMSRCCESNGDREGKMMKEKTYDERVDEECDREFEERKMGLSKNKVMSKGGGVIPKEKGYEIVWSDSISGETIEETYRILCIYKEHLEQLLELEKQGLIKAECEDISPSIQRIIILDERARSIVEHNGLVLCYEIDRDDNGHVTQNYL